MTPGVLKELMQFGGLGLAAVMVWMQWKSSLAKDRELDRRNRRDQEIIVDNTRAMEGLRRVIYDRPCLRGGPPISEDGT